MLNHKQEKVNGGFDIAGHAVLSSRLGLTMVPLAHGPLQVLLTGPCRMQTWSII